MSAKSRTRKDKEDTVNTDLAINGIGNYTFHKTVGEGNFAKVKLGKHKLTNAEVAVKIIDKSTLDEKKLNKLYREVRIMKMLHHPNIVKLYEVIETKQTLFLVMEYASGGELYDYLVVHGKMKEKEARAKFRQILSAVSYCHKKRVIHRDLKAENLLLDANLDIKIADFGFSNYFDPESKLDTFCGSPPYAAPELFQGRRYTGPEVDIWSLGVILYVLTTGCLPFDGKNLQEMRESVCRGKYRIPFYLSDTCEKLLRKFLIRDPYKRASLDMLIDDLWINEGYTDSPISIDLSQTFAHDESIVKLIETRFKLDRETVMASLREEVYDDIAAIYHLLYFEKDTRAKIEAEVTAMGKSGTSSLLITSPITPDTPKKETKKVDKTPAMGAIGEDEVLAVTPITPVSTAKPLANQATLATPAQRKRRVTVGGEAEFNKFAEDESSAAALKQFQATGAAMGAATGAATAGTATAEPSATKKPVVDATTAAKVPSEGPATVAVAGGPGTEGPEGQQGRKRNNTIVGIFRKPGRRPSELSGPNNGGVGEEIGTNIVQSNDSTAEGSPRPGEPRSLRFTFNSNSTSSKSPDEIVKEVTMACTKHGIQAKVVTRYLIECSCVTGPEPVKFDIEICKLPRLKNLHGLRFKRMGGSSVDYKEVCEKILNSVEL